MTLATRCPTCGTSFRVVPDQLKVSDGYARCGRCSEVFNAIEHLFDVDVETPATSVATATPAPAFTAPPQAPPFPNPAAQDAGAPPAWWATPAPPSDDFANGDGARVFAAAPSTPAWPVPAPTDAVLPVEDTALPSDLVDERPAFDAAPEIDLDLPAAPAATVHAADGHAGDEAEPGAAALPPSAADEAVPLHSTADGVAAAAAQPDAVAITLDGPASAAPTAAPPIEMIAIDDSPASVREPAVRVQGAGVTPSFLRDARRRAAPSRRSTLWLSLLTLLLALGAIGQATIAWREPLVAAWPSLRPALEPLCAAVGCRIEAPRRLADLAVESSGLVHIGTEPVYRLSIVLRNRGETALRVPAVDLTLTDTRGRTVARRVLGAGEFGITAEGIAPRAELPMQATFRSAEPVTGGYTIELFYP